MRINKIFLVLAFLISLNETTMSQNLLTAEQITPVEHALHGYRSAVSGGWALVSSPQKDIGDRIAEGSVTFYKLTNGQWKVFQEVTPPSSTSSLSNFGSDIDIQGNTAVISSVGDFVSGRFSGAVYIYNYDYEKEQWVFSQKIKADDSFTGHRYGHSLDIKENYLVVGAQNADGNAERSGAAYVYKYGGDESGWVLSQKIFSNDGAPNDFFGFEVHIMDARHIAIGAYNANNSEGTVERTGATYVFKTNDDGLTWTQEANLRVPEAQFSDLFGYTISSGPKQQKETGDNYDGILFVGAPGTVNENGKTGSVYFFVEEENGWINSFELIEPVIGHNDHFGHSITVNSKGHLFVGANRYNTNVTRKSGVVYYYDTYYGSGYTSSQNFELSGSLLSDYDHYGSHISLDDENIIVSRPYADINGVNNSGSVDFFRLDNLVEFETDLSQVYILKQNTPNPSEESTFIEYQMKLKGDVKLSVYNQLGQLVKVLVDEEKDYGVYQVQIDSDNYSAGIYLYTLEVNGFKSTKRMIISN